jgi:hypothetical protein
MQVDCIIDRNKLRIVKKRDTKVWVSVPNPLPSSMFSENNPFPYHQLGFFASTAAAISASLPLTSLKANMSSGQCRSAHASWYSLLCISLRRLMMRSLAKPRLSSTTTLDWAGPERRACPDEVRASCWVRMWAKSSTGSASAEHSSRVLQ